MLADDERAMKDLNKSIEIDFANLAALLARANAAWSRLALPDDSDRLAACRPREGGDPDRTP